MRKSALRLYELKPEIMDAPARNLTAGAELDDAVAIDVRADVCALSSLVLT